MEINKCKGNVISGTLNLAAFRPDFLSARPFDECLSGDTSGVFSLYPAAHSLRAPSPGPDSRSRRRMFIWYFILFAAVLFLLFGGGAAPVSILLFRLYDLKSFLCKSKYLLCGRTNV